MHAHKKSNRRANMPWPAVRSWEKISGIDLFHGRGWKQKLSERRQQTTARGLSMNLFPWVSGVPSSTFPWAESLRLRSGFDPGWFFARIHDVPQGFHSIRKAARNPLKPSRPRKSLSEDSFPCATGKVAAVFSQPQGLSPEERLACNQPMSWKTYQTDCQIAQCFSQP